MLNRTGPERLDAWEQVDPKRRASAIQIAVARVLTPTQAGGAAKSFAHRTPHTQQGADQGNAGHEVAPPGHPRQAIEIAAAEQMHEHRLALVIEVVGGGDEVGGVLSCRARQGFVSALTCQGEQVGGIRRWAPATLTRDSHVFREEWQAELRRQVANECLVLVRLGPQVVMDMNHEGLDARRPPSRQRC